MVRLWREHIGKHAGLLWLALFFMALTAAATGFTAWLMEPIVNDVFLSAKEDALWLVSGAILAAFVVKGVAPDVPMNTIFRGIWPFWFAMLIAILILVAVPEIALLLPDTMLGGG